MERGEIIARKQRVWFPGATYHLMERGIRRQAIYKEESDYQAFISILQSGLEKYGCILHAYCLMTNHFHMLLETGETDVSKFMKHLAGCYARYFNQKYMYQGHLFEGRYKSILVKDDTYFLQTSRYIHLNPVKAGMVENPEDYPWSSYRTMLRMNSDKITQSSRTHAYFGKNPVVYYRQFIEDIGRKYVMEEDRIRRSIGEDDLWLPW